MKFPIFKNAYFVLIIAFVVWRTFLFLIASYSPFFINNFGDKFPYKQILYNSELPDYVWSFGNFDGVHYLGIAQYAYDKKFTQAFFPLYPVLIRLFSFFTFENYLLAALLVSNIAFLASLILFFRMLSTMYNQKVAIWSVLFLLAFPMSYYFVSAYSESLFLFLILGYFYLNYRKKIFLASLFGALASATRIIGAFLVLTLKLGKTRSTILPLAIIPLGILSYMLYLTLVFKNPFYFISAQQVFGHERSTQGIVLLPQVFWRYFKIITTTSGASLLNASFELISTIFVLTLLIFAYKKVKGEWLIFSFVSVILPTLSGTLVSMPRYILVAFPMYIVLAQIKNTWAKTIILSIFFILLVVLTALFTRGYWVA